MRAAQIAELGQPPEAVEVQGNGPIEIVAVALNPLDLAVAAGRFYGGHPPLPYVPGCEAVGRRDGERVYLFGEGWGTRRDGFLVERADFPAALAVPVPAELEDAVAAACGIAGIAGWLPVAKRAPVQPHDRVLVLGATGTVGSVALQAARVLGAERVVAAGRDHDRLERARELGAEATVPLDGDDLAERLREACGGDGPTLIVDPLWGEPVRAAAEAAAPQARIVHVGQSAGPEATFDPQLFAESSSRSSVTRTSPSRRTSAGRRISRLPDMLPPAGSGSTSRRFRSIRWRKPGSLKREESKRLSASEVVYVSNVRVERIRGPLRRAEVPGSAEPIYFGVHDEVADHYGVPRGGEAERTTTLDYVVAAAAG